MGRRGIVFRVVAAVAASVLAFAIPGGSAMADEVSHSVSSTPSAQGAPSSQALSAASDQTSSTPKTSSTSNPAASSVPTVSSPNGEQSAGKSQVTPSSPTASSSSQSASGSKPSSSAAASAVSRPGASAAGSSSSSVSSVSSPSGSSKSNSSSSKSKDSADSSVSKSKEPAESSSTEASHSNTSEVESSASPSEDAAIAKETENQDQPDSSASVQPQDGMEPVVSTQGTCTPTRQYWTANGSTLWWNKHVDGDDCVLQLESGEMQNYGYSAAPDGDWEGYLKPKIPWIWDDQITEVTVNAGVVTHQGFYLFSQLHSLRYADLTQLNISNSNSLEAMFQNDWKLTQIKGLDRWNVTNVDTTWQMFGFCYDLTVLDLSSWDLRRAVAGTRIHGDGITYSDATSIFNGLGPTLRFLRLGPNSGLSALVFNPTPDATDTWTGVQWNREDTGATAYYPKSSGLPAPSTPTWYGITPTSLTYNGNGSDSGTVPSPSTAAWPDSPEANVTLPAMAGFRKSGHRAAGWSMNQNASSAEYQANQAVHLPLENIARSTLYAIWHTLPISTATLMSSAGTPAAPATVLGVSGTIAQGTGIASLDQAGDAVAAKLLPQDKQTSTTEADGAALGSITFNSTAHTWSGSVAVSDLAAADTVGKGLSYVFRARSTTSADGNSEYGFSAGLKADVVAPAFKANSLKFDQNAGTVSGTVLSGDKATHSGAVAEQGDTVTVTWPTGSTTASSIAMTDSDGTFTVTIPAGVLLNGNASLTVKDAPASDVPTLTGTGSPNVSAVSTLDVTAQTVSSLPMTGYTKPWWTEPWFYALFAAAGIVIVNVVFRRRAQHPDIFSH